MDRASTRRRIDAVFAEALELPAADRTAYLDRASAGDPALRGAVERLLANAEREDDFLDSGSLQRDPLWEEALDAMASSCEPATIQLIGPYRVLRELGRGGMGTVYLAERADAQFDQRVALKVIRRDADTDDALARFHQERQILASLDHPGIARLLDGGVAADGRSYFAMDYVRGRPIDVFCRERELGVEDRILLFRQVGEAVSYAHRNLMVHRDLKPSNILVTDDGRAKLLDFGIAKLLPPGERSGAAPVTRTAMRVLTPEYASPEQIRGDPITTAADVFQLGVLLYELLTGKRPFVASGSGISDLERAICESEPPRPSSALEPGDRRHRRLTVDLESIVLKALRKEPERRYRSVEEMLDDLDRYSNGRPVIARRDTLRYRVGKFVRRHRYGVAATAALVALLVGYAATITVQAGVVAAERDLARLEAARKQKVTDFLVDMLQTADPRTAPEGAAVGEALLAAGAERVATELEGEVALQAQVLEAIGSIYLARGSFDQAEPLLQRSVDLSRSQDGDSDTLARALTRLGEVERYRSNFDVSRGLLTEALELLRARHGESHMGVADALSELANLEVRMENYELAEEHARQSLELSKRLTGHQSEETAEASHGLATLLHEAGRYEEAHAAYRETIEVARSVDEDHFLATDALAGLAALERERGRNGESERLYREVLSRRRRVYGDRHESVAWALDGLGLLLANMKRHEEAEVATREALALRIELLGENTALTATSFNNLGRLLRGMGRLEEAEWNLRRALEIWRDTLGDDHNYVGVAQAHIAGVLEDQDRLDEAEQMYRESVARYEGSLPEGHPRISHPLTRLGQVLSKMGRPADAVPVLRRSWELRRAGFGECESRTLDAARLLAGCLVELEHDQEARSLLEPILDNCSLGSDARDRLVEILDQTAPGV